jgi:hypothetical protein
MQQKRDQKRTNSHRPSDGKQDSIPSQDQQKDQQKPIIPLLNSFNDEAIWDNQNPLFELYFKDSFINNKYKYCNFTILEHLTFEDSLNILVSYN